MYEGSCTHLPLAPRDSFTVREFLTIAINKKKAVKMAANEQDRKKAAGLQKALETQLLALEKLGALPTPAADEVRNIVAEGIADKFGEPYRNFPCAREGIEIRRDAVPKQCSLRRSVEGFVANASSLEKTTKTKGRESPRKAASVAKPTTAKDRATFSALAQVNKPQHTHTLRLTVGHSARHAEAEPRNTSSPGKQHPETSPKPPNPTKGGTTQDLQQASLESGKKAWDVLLAQKAAENKTTPARNNDQRKLTAQGTGNPSASVTQGTGAGLRKDGRIATAAGPKNATSAPTKGAMASQSLEATAETSGEGRDRRTTPGKSGKPKSSRKPSIDSSEDLIDFGF